MRCDEDGFAGARALVGRDDVVDLRAAREAVGRRALEGGLDLGFVAVAPQFLDDAVAHDWCRVEPVMWERFPSAGASKVANASRAKPVLAGVDGARSCDCQATRSAPVNAATAASVACCAMCPVVIREFPLHCGRWLRASADRLRRAPVFSVCMGNFSDHAFVALGLRAMQT